MAEYKNNRAERGDVITPAVVAEITAADAAVFAASV